MIDLSRYQSRLMSLAEKHLSEVMRSRVSPEDVVQETFAAATQRANFFEKEPEVPEYFKLRKIFFQTLVSLERKHLGAQKRDAYKEIGEGELKAEGNDEETISDVGMDRFASTVTGPVTAASRKERNFLLKAAIKRLSEADRQIIEMRHFDDMSNDECAEVLGLSKQAASVRYVRALERLQKELLKFTEFQ